MGFMLTCPIPMTRNIEGKAGHVLCACRHSSCTEDFEASRSVGEPDRCMLRELKGRHGTNEEDVQRVQDAVRNHYPTGIYSNLEIA